MTTRASSRLARPLLYLGLVAVGLGLLIAMYLRIVPAPQAMQCMGATTQNVDANGEARHTDGTGNLQFAMQRLRDANAGGRPVRILFYGQSITEQGWWLRTVEHLHKSFPNAVLQVENRAIGAHTSDRLLRTAEADLYPYQPDLVVFHVYGDHHQYASIIESIRKRTTSDVLIATDHITNDSQVGEDTNRARLTFCTWLYRLKGSSSEPDRLANWAAWRNHVFLPDIATKYGAKLADVRSAWKAYLRSHHLKANQLLVDDIHLNAEGQALMANIINASLSEEASLPARPADDRVVERPVDAASHSGERLRIPFDGNRIDALLKPGGAGGQDVAVDGQPPCKSGQALAITRTTPYPHSNWPTLLRVSRGVTPLLAESWTVTVRGADEALKNFRFDVSGSVTGPDGSGTSTAKFVSKSGRVVINPEDWNLWFAKAVLKTTIPDGFLVQWTATCHGADSLPSTPSSVGIDTVTLVEGITNGKHVLDMPLSAASSVASLRIYRPLLGREP